MILQFDNVLLKWNGKWILRDIYWKVEEKENWVFYGLNGVGKIVLLNMFCLYYFLILGEMEVFGYEFGKMEFGEKFRWKIGFVLVVFQ